MSTEKQPFKLKWWHIIGGLIVLGYIGNIINPKRSNSQTHAFDDVYGTISLMEATGVGRFYRYNCGDNNECQAYIGSRPEPKEEHVTTAMSINGSPDRIFNISIQCIIYKDTKDKEGSVHYFKQIVGNTIRSLGGDNQVIETILSTPVSDVKWYGYEAFGSLKDDVYEVEIHRGN